MQCRLTEPLFFRAAYSLFAGASVAACTQTKGVVQLDIIKALLMTPTHSRALNALAPKPQLSRAVRALFLGPAFVSMRCRNRSILWTLVLRQDLNGKGLVHSRPLVRLESPTVLEGAKSGKTLLRG